MAKIDVVMSFRSRGVLTTGLSPTLKILDTSGNILKNDVEMSDIGLGSYLYVFSTANVLKNYLFKADGTDILTNPNERFLEASWSGIDAYVDNIKRSSGAGSTTLSRDELEKIKKVVKDLLDNVKIDLPEDTRGDLIEKGLSNLKKENEKFVKDLQKKFKAIEIKKKIEIKAPKVDPPNMDKEIEKIKNVLDENKDLLNDYGEFLKLLFDENASFLKTAIETIRGKKLKKLKK